MPSAPPPLYTPPSENPAYVRGRGRLGTTLRGKYRLDRILGMGGMAVVYAATHRNRAKFAIKVLHAELSIRDDVRNRFLREGYVANTVGHAGAVAVVDDDLAEDGSAFIVMELLDGATVEALSVSRNAPLSVPAALAIGYQLLDVLAAAHANGVVHRDIKPANLFVTRDGALKVLDFGIARLREATGGGDTATGATLGTPAFMGPEQAIGNAKEIDAQSDIWAVGATLFWAITGQLVHEGGTGSLLMVKSATAKARPIASVVPSIPSAIADLIDRALAFDKRDRWRSALAMQEAIRAAYLAMYGDCSEERVRADLVSSVKAQLVAAQPRAGGASDGRAVVPSPLHDADTGAPWMSPKEPGGTAHSAGRFSESELLRASLANASTIHVSERPGPDASGERAHAGESHEGPAPLTKTMQSIHVPEPVASTRREVEPLPSGRATRGGLLGLAVLGATLAAVLVVRSRGAAPAAVEPSLSPGSDIRADDSPPPRPVEPHAAAPSALPKPEASDAPAPGPSAAVTLPAAKGPTVVPPRSAVVAPRAPPAVTPPPAPTTKPDCDPNYYLDKDGERHLKKGCF